MLVSNGIACSLDYESMRLIFYISFTIGNKIFSPNMVANKPDVYRA